MPLTKMLMEHFIALRQDTLMLCRAGDGSFIVGFKSDIGENPNLLIGCIGQWVNTDDLEWAEEIYNALVHSSQMKVLRHYASVTECLKWRDIVGTCH